MAAVTRRIKRYRRTPAAEVWQSGYWEVIIRYRRHLQNVRRYSQANPAGHAARARLDVLLKHMTWRD